MKCPMGQRKKRSSRGHGHPSDYVHSLRGHTWKKLIQNNQHIGRTCKCGKTILNARGIILKR